MSDKNNNNSQIADMWEELPQKAQMSVPLTPVVRHAMSSGMKIVVALSAVITVGFVISSFTEIQVAKNIFQTLFIATVLSLLVMLTLAVNKRKVATQKLQDVVEIIVPALEERYGIPFSETIFYHLAQNYSVHLMDMNGDFREVWLRRNTSNEQEQTTILVAQKTAN